MSFDGFNGIYPYSTIAKELKMKAAHDSSLIIRILLYRRLQTLCHSYFCTNEFFVCIQLSFIPICRPLQCSSLQLVWTPPYNIFKLHRLDAMTMPKNFNKTYFQRFIPQCQFVLSIISNMYINNINFQFMFNL